MDVDFKYDFGSGKKQVILRYEPGEWERVKAQLIRLGLRENVTQSAAWGDNEYPHVAYYQDTEGHRLYDFIYRNITNAAAEYGFQAIDEVNSPVLRGNQFNLAIFRTVPVDGKVVAGTTDMPTSLNKSTIGKVIQKAYTELMNTLGEVDYHVAVHDISELPPIPTEPIHTPVPEVRNRQNFSRIIEQELARRAAEAEPEETEEETEEEASEPEAEAEPEEVNESNNNERRQLS